MKLEELREMLKKHADDKPLKWRLPDDAASKEQLENARRCVTCGHLRKMTQNGPSSVYIIEPCTACAR